MNDGTNTTFGKLPIGAEYHIPGRSFTYRKISLHHGRVLHDPSAKHVGTTYTVGWLMDVLTGPTAACRNFRQRQMEMAER